MIESSNRANHDLLLCVFVLCLVCVRVTRFNEAILANLQDQRYRERERERERERDRDREKVIEQGGREGGREGCVREKRDLTRAARRW